MAQKMGNQNKKDDAKKQAYFGVAQITPYQKKRSAGYVSQTADNKNPKNTGNDIAFYKFLERQPKHADP